MRKLAATMLLIVVLAPPGSVRASEDQSQAAFGRANEAYAAGRYEEAAQGFRSLLEQSVISSALLYDLGNALAKDGRVGHAVLAYERALSLAPRDADILANLRQTRSAANLPTPERSGWETLAASGTVDEWAWIAIVGLVVSCLAVSRHALRSTGSRQPSRAIVGTALLGILCAGLATGLCLSRLAQLNRYVLVGDAPALRVAPFDTATISTELPSGLLVSVERRHQSFALVRTNDGQAGWMPEPDVEGILPH